METPEFFETGYYDTQFTPEKGHSDQFVIEDLLDFPNDETLVMDEESVVEGGMTPTGTSTDSSTVTVAVAVAVANNASSFQQTGDIIGGTHGQFSSELCVPYDEVADLEWLSHFVDESFSSTEDLEKLHLIQGMKVPTTTEPSSQAQAQETNYGSGPIFGPERTVPAKARSKRSRAPAGNWNSRLLVVSGPTSTPTPTPTISSSSTESDMGMKRISSLKKKELVAESGGEGRKCLHCSTDKTPQWRTGPMGPKTLCNACGVRFKSGRLVPEYRPAASPTFVQARHSNSHRKVLELRRQKEMQVRVQQHQHQQHFMHQNNNMNMNMNMNMIYDSDDYLIHQHIGPDYRQII